MKIFAWAFRIALATMASVILVAVPAGLLLIFILSDFAGGYRVPKTVADLVVLEPFALSLLNALIVGFVTRKRYLPVFAFVVATLIGRLIGSFAATGLGDLLSVWASSMDLFQWVTLDMLIRLAFCIGLSWIFCVIYPRTNTTLA